MAAETPEAQPTIESTLGALHAHFKAGDKLNIPGFLKTVYQVKELGHDQNPTVVNLLKTLGRAREKVIGNSVLGVLEQAHRAGDVAAIRRNIGALRMLGLDTLPGVNTLIDALTKAHRLEEPTVAEPVAPTTVLADQGSRVGAGVVLDPDVIHTVTTGEPVASGVDDGKSSGSGEQAATDATDQPPAWEDVARTGTHQEGDTTSGGGEPATEDRVDPEDQGTETPLQRTRKLAAEFFRKISEGELEDVSERDREIDSLVESIPQEVKDQISELISKYHTLQEEGGNDQELAVQMRVELDDILSDVGIGGAPRIEQGTPSPMMHELETAGINSEEDFDRLANQIRAVYAGCSDNLRDNLERLLAARRQVVFPADPTGETAAGRLAYAVFSFEMQQSIEGGFLREFSECGSLSGMHLFYKEMLGEQLLATMDSGQGDIDRIIRDSIFVRINREELTKRETIVRRRVNEFEQGLRNRTEPTFAESLAQMQMRSFTAQHPDIFDLSGEPGAEEEYMRLQSNVSKLVNTVQLQDIDPSVLSDLSDSNWSTIVSIVADQGAQAPKEWQEALRQAQEQDPGLNRGVLSVWSKTRLRACADRLQQILPKDPWSAIGIPVLDAERDRLIRAVVDITGGILDSHTLGYIMSSYPKNVQIAVGNTIGEVHLRDERYLTAINQAQQGHERNPAATITANLAGLASRGAGNYEEFINGGGTIGLKLVVTDMRKEIQYLMPDVDPAELGRIIAGINNWAVRQDATRLYRQLGLDQQQYQTFIESARVVGAELNSPEDEFVEVVKDVAINGKFPP